jgi:hypothetical protein
MTSSRPVMTRSKGRCPRDCAASSTKATTAVISPPMGSGTPNSRLSATAPPTISARSVAIATASACSHSPRVTGFGSCSRQLVARSRPVASPSLAVRLWMSIAIRLAATITHSSV